MLGKVYLSSGELTSPSQVDNLTNNNNNNNNDLLKFHWDDG